MVLGVVLGVLWVLYIFINLGGSSRMAVKVIGRNIAPVTQGWGMRPRYGDEYESIKPFNVFMVVIVTIAAVVMIYFAMDLERLGGLLSANKPLGFILAFALFLGVLLVISYWKARMGDQRLYERVPAGNCLVLYKKPMVVRESYIFTLIFGVGDNQTDSPDQDDSEDSDLEKDFPRPAGARLRGIHYSLDPKARGHLQVKAIAPAFRVSPDLREIKLPVKGENDRAKFVVVPTEPGQHAFVFEISNKEDLVGSFETMIPIQSLVVDRASKLVQIITPFATLLTLVFQILNYLKK